jgi:hypothetical protein
MLLLCPDHLVHDECVEGSSFMCQHVSDGRKPLEQSFEFTGAKDPVFRKGPSPGRRKCTSHSVLLDAPVVPGCAENQSARDIRSFQVGSVQVGFAEVGLAQIGFFKSAR